MVHRPIRKPALLLTLLCGALPAAAQSTGGPVLQGPADEIEDRSIRVMGQTVQLPGGLVDTPAAFGVSGKRLKDDVAGRKKGFRNSTVVIRLAQGNGAPVAESAYASLDLATVTGLVTSAAGSPLEVNGLPVRPSTGLLPAEGYRNLYGFEIAPASVTRGMMVTMTGYFTTDHDDDDDDDDDDDRRKDGPRSFYFHRLMVGDGAPVQPNAEVSITRARCRLHATAAGGELEVQGWVHAAAFAPLPEALPEVTLTLATAAGEQQVPVPVTRDPANQHYGRYRLAGARDIAACPITVTAAWGGDLDQRIAVVDLGAVD